MRQERLKRDVQAKRAESRPASGFECYLAGERKILWQGSRCLRCGEDGVEKMETFLGVKVSGAKDDALLGTLSGKTSRLVTVHVCSPGCFRPLRGRIFSMERAMRRWIQLQNHGSPIWRRWCQSVMGWTSWRGSGDRGKKEDRKEEKKSKRKREKGEAGDRKGAKEKKEDSATDSSDSEVGRCSLEDPQTRSGGKRFFGRRSRRQRRRKKGVGAPNLRWIRGSSAGLFDSEAKLQKVWRRFPGALTANMVGEAKSRLLTAAGAMWEADKKSIPPICARSNVMPLISQWHRKS